MKSKATYGLLVGAGLMAMAATAQAADVSLSSSNPFDGFYMGVHAGYGWADSAIDYEGDYGYSISSNQGDDGDFAGDFSLDSKGALLGAQAGANFVTDAGFLVGAEVSTSWSDISGQQSFVGGDANITAEQSISAIGLAQLKLGFATETLAIYGLGGLALGQLNTAASLENDVCDVDCVSLDLVNISDKQVVTGWTIGAGVDQMVTENVSIGATYNYVKFNYESDYDVDGGIDPWYLILGEVNTDTSATAHLVKATLNYHF